MFMSSSGVAPTVPIVAEAAFIHLASPMTMLVDGMSSHVASGETAGVPVLTIAAFDWAVTFPQHR